MDLHKSHDTPSAASGLAQAQTACCGASNERAPVILINDGADDRSTVELIQRLESSGVCVLGAGDSGALNVGSLRDAHPTEMLRIRRRQSPAMQALVAAALIGGMAIPDGMLSPARMHSSPPPIAPTEQDYMRIAAAQAKRDRRAAKRIGAQS